MKETCETSTVAHTSATKPSAQLRAKKSSSGRAVGCEAGEPSIRAHWPWRGPDRKAMHRGPSVPRAA